MCDDERMVPNPYLAALDSLIRRTGNAVDATPDMDGPTEVIGDGPAWTGSKAREMHDDYLAPNAGPVRTALQNLVGDVEQRKAEFEPEVTESIAHVIRIELDHR